MEVFTPATFFHRKMSRFHATFLFIVIRFWGRSIGGTDSIVPRTYKDILLWNPTELSHGVLLDIKPKSQGDSLLVRIFGKAWLLIKHDHTNSISDRHLEKPDDLAHFLWVKNVDTYVLSATFSGT